MNQELPVNNPPWGKLIATYSDKQNISLSTHKNEHLFANEWSIFQNQDGKIYIKNISAPHLRVEETILQIDQERELVSGERLCLNKKKKSFDYVFLLANSQSDLKREKDVNLEPESLKKLERIENDLQKELTCPICTNYLEKCMVLSPCFHTFCGFCLFHQLKCSSKCPLCRAEAVSVAKNSVLSNVTQIIEENFSIVKDPQKRKELEEINFGGAIVRYTGGVYIGSYANGKKDGQGKFIYQDNRIYEGSWKNDKREGKGIFIYNDEGKYDGYWRNDLKHGVGKYIRSDGQEYEGDFKNNVRHGYGIMKFQAGGVYKGDWINGKRDGKGCMSYLNGDRYDGSWMNDQRHGTGKFIWSYGQEYEGSFHHDCLTGTGKMKYQDGMIWLCHWENGKKSGEGILRHKNGDKYKGIWIHNVLQPQVKVEYSNGEKYEGEIDIENFEKQGKGIRILNNGDKYKGTWIHNVLQPQVTIEYSNGDQYEGEINVENLQKHGKGVLTFKNRDLYEGNWMNDMQHGQGKEIYRGGKRMFEGVWEKGEITREFIMTNEDGNRYQVEMKKLEVEILKASSSDDTDIDDSKTQDSDHAQTNDNS